MDRIINVKVGGSYLSKDKNTAGVRGEANVTHLRITFDESWDSYAKTVTFWDARGANPVKITLTTDLLENISENTRIYLVPIPAEPMAESGMFTFVIDGYIDGKRQRSLAGKLEVEYAPITDNSEEPADPTPTQAEQIQKQVDYIVREIQNTYVNASRAVTAKDEAHEYMVKASSSEYNANTSAYIARDAATKAENAVGKTSYIGEDGNWYAWDSSTGAFYNTGIKAQSGSIVYIGDNPPADASVWIQPDGKSYAYASVRAFVNMLGGAGNWIKEDVFDANNNVIGSRYGQVVNVNNAIITPYSKVDLQITSEQMVVFHEKDLAFVAENDEGVVTIYCIGSIPQNDYTIQAMVTEVIADA